MSAVEDRLAALEQRLRVLEDERAVLRLIASYGPAVDRGDAEATAALWATDGSYEVGGMEPFQGAEQVGALVEIEEHRGYLAAGCAHVLSLPRVTLDGDRARAVGYSRVYRRHEDGEWHVIRVSANTWELVRGPDGWRVAHRTARLLDGTPEARDLLR